MEASLEAALREVPEKLKQTMQLDLERRNRWRIIPRANLRGSREGGGRANGGKDSDSRELHSFDFQIFDGK